MALLYFLCGLLLLKLCIKNNRKDLLKKMLKEMSILDKIIFSIIWFVFLFIFMIVKLDNFLTRERKKKNGN